MKETGRYFCMAMVLFFISCRTMASGWEILSANPRMMNIEVMGSTWYGIEYHGSSKSIFLSSSNKGHRWDTVPGFSDIFLIRAYKETLLVSGIYNDFLGFYLSTDKAQTWKKLNWPYSSSALDMLVNDTSIIMYVSKSNTVESPLYRSLDDGSTWEALPIDVGDVNWNGNFRGGKLHAFHNTIGAYIISAGFFYSPDGGNTWVKNMEGLPELSPVQQTALSLMPDGFSIPYGSGWYKFDGSQWIGQDYNRYYYSTFHQNWKVSDSKLSPLVQACRLPYIFAHHITEISGRLYYSVDNGKKWFEFTDYATGFSSVFNTSVIIDGNYVYGGFVQGFARRSLSEAKNHVIEEEKEKEYPVSPEGMENLLGLLGADALEDILDQMGIDSDEMTDDEMTEFLNDFMDNAPSSLFGNSQPGSCSFMGMPLWSLNVANLKLFMRDVLYRKQGLGPELNLAIHHIHTADTTSGFFGQNWRFQYQQDIVQHDSMVVLTTGTGANFIFSENKAVLTGASPFTLPCLNKKNFKLHWTGTTWRVEKGYGYEFLNFAHVSANRFALASIEDAYDKKITLGYDAHHRLVKVTDAAGREHRLTYTGNLCDSIILPEGNFATFSYNSENQLESTIDFAGIVSAYTYDTVNNIASVDIAGKTTAFTYYYETDTLGTVSSVTDPEGRTISYFTTPIDTATRVTNVSYPDNKNISYIITNGRVESINANGEEKKVFYNAQGQPDSLVWYDGSYLTFLYDSEGNMVYKRDRFGNVTQYGYNASGKLIVEKDGQGDILTSYTYNANNQMESLTLADGRTTTYTYNENGALASVTSPGGQVSSFARDAFGNIATFTNPLGHTMHYHYDKNGAFPSGLTDFNGNKYNVTYDNNGRLLKVEMPDGSEKNYHYDCCTQTGITDENGNTISVLRDATNRITQKTTAGGMSGTLGYDDGGYLSSVTTLYGMVKEFEYNNRGLLVSMTDEEGQTGFDYDNRGLLVTVTDKVGNQSKFTYNSQNKITRLTDAAGKSTFLGYDSKQRLNEVTNARGQKMTLLYNSMGLVSNKKQNNNTLATYTYNENGELTAWTDSLGTTSLTRNAAGFVTSISYPGGFTVSFEHDANGNIVKTTYPNGLEVNNTPDPLNRITNINWGASYLNFTYDAGGNLLSEERSNNTQTLYGYNKDNVLISLSHEVSDTVLTGEAVEMKNGMISSISLKPAASVMRLPEKLLNMSVNSLNQLEGNMVNNLYLPHDADGNLTAFYDKNILKMSATYSHDNLLSSIKTPTHRVDLRYGAMRYPEKIAINGEIAYLFYDHKGRLLFETNSEGLLTKNYIYRGKRLIAEETAQNETRFYHSSRQGHTLAITSTNGEVLNAYTYSATGELIGKIETIANRFTFLGTFGALSLDDKYILTGARVYSTAMGRYLQRDPLGIFTGTNPYLYAANNPVSGIDPLGFSDQQTTVNSLDFDFPSDNDYGTAGGTSNPYAEDLPYRSNNWDTYGSAAMKTLEDFSNHPVSDLLPDAIANPTSILKAIDKLANKEYGGALYQFVPFNNSIDAVGNYIMEKTKYTDPTKFNGLGIFPNNTQQSFTCEM
jgi:RHS repeat-associated protein